MLRNATQKQSKDCARCSPCNIAKHDLAEARVRVGLENYPCRLSTIRGIYVDYRLPAIIVQRPCPNYIRTLAIALFEESATLCYASRFYQSQLQCWSLIHIYVVHVWPLLIQGTYTNFIPISWARFPAWSVSQTLAWPLTSIPRNPQRTRGYYRL